MFLYLFAELGESLAALASSGWVLERKKAKAARAEVSMLPVCP